MSRNSLGNFSNGFEYFIHDGAIYRAPSANPVGVDGYRQGARFECHVQQWQYLVVLLSR